MVHSACTLRRLGFVPRAHMPSASSTVGVHYKRPLKDSNLRPFDERLPGLVWEQNPARCPYSAIPAQRGNVVVLAPHQASC